MKDSTTTFLLGTLLVVLVGGVLVALFRRGGAQPAIPAEPSTGDAIGELWDDVETLINKFKK